MATEEKRANPVRILIYDIDGPGKGRPHVTPGHAVVEANEEVSWQNVTDDRVEVLLPASLSQSKGVQRLMLEPGGTSDPITFEDPEHPGGHSYLAVRHKKRGSLEVAVGGSNPVIVIR